MALLKEERLAKIESLALLMEEFLKAARANLATVTCAEFILTDALTVIAGESIMKRPVKRLVDAYRALKDLQAPEKL